MRAIASLAKLGQVNFTEVAMHTIHYGKKRLITCETILDGLEEAQVVRIEKDGDLFHVREACDEYFMATLTKDQLITLADELRAFAER
jgi:hypothetical protein